MKVERETHLPPILEDPSPAGEVSPPWISAAATVPAKPEPDYSDDEESSDDFEFAFPARGFTPDVTAVEMFSDGRIRPLYPLAIGEETVIGLPFRKLTIEEREVSPSSGSMSSSSSSIDDLEGVSPESYCMWSPMQDRYKKSRSTGSVSRRWRLLDVMIGRSHSDGFLSDKEKKWSSPSSEISKSKTVAAKRGRKEKGNEKGVKPMEMDIVTAHKLYYSKNNGGGGSRRSFLPYKKDLVGLFGLDLTHRPF